MMRAGRLRHIITIHDRVDTQDAFGSVVTSWATFATVHASVEPLSGRELFAAQTVNSETKAKIRMRYLSGVTQDMRISFSGKIYNIVTIINHEEKNRELTLMCSEGVNDG